MVVVIILRDWLFLRGSQHLFGEVKGPPLKFQQPKRPTAVGEGIGRKMTLPL